MIGSTARRFTSLRRGKGLFYSLGALAVAAVVVVALNAVYGFLDGSSASGSAQRTATVARGIVQSSVSASGNVGVASSAAVGFTTSGRLTRVDVKVGDKVKAGQVLAAIDATSARNALQQATANLAQAESTLASARAGPTTAQQLSNQSSIQQAETQLTTARQQLSADQDKPGGGEEAARDRSGARVPAVERDCLGRLRRLVGERRIGRLCDRTVRQLDGDRKGTAPGSTARIGLRVRFHSCRGHRLRVRVDLRRRQRLRLEFGRLER